MDTPVASAGLSQLRNQAMVKLHIVAFSLTMAHSSWLWL